MCCRLMFGMRFEKTAGHRGCTLFNRVSDSRNDVNGELMDGMFNRAEAIQSDPNKKSVMSFYIITLGNPESLAEFKSINPLQIS